MGARIGGPFVLLGPIRANSFQIRAHLCNSLPWLFYRILTKYHKSYKSGIVGGAGGCKFVSSYGNKDSTYSFLIAVSFGCVPGILTGDSFFLKASLTHPGSQIGISKGF